MTDAQAIAELRHIHSIGLSLARDLFALGVRQVEDLRRVNPQQLYEQLCEQMR